MVRCAMFRPFCQHVPGLKDCNLTDGVAVEVSAPTSGPGSCPAGSWGERKTSSERADAHSFSHDLGLFRKANLNAMKNGQIQPSGEGGGP